MIKNKNLKGIGLIEIIIGASIISLSMVGLITAFNLFIRAGLTNTDKIQAIYLLEESSEVFRYIRDGGWTTNINSLSKNTPYYLVLENSNWSATTTQALIDETFNRTITIYDVYRRNSDSDIVASTSPDAKTLDQNIVQITANVFWDKGSVDSTTYLTNMLNN
jgi:type II secretory pathway pseudopilin PulG